MSRRYSAHKGESPKFFKGVRVPDPITFRDGQTLWVMTNEETGREWLKTAERTPMIYDSHTWLVTGSELCELVGPGVCEVRPRGLVPLKSRIVVSGNSSAQVALNGEAWE